MELTHASFFSGVGGLDMGLERAGWRTVSFSEIDAYASAVLAERWPGVSNLGDITDIASGTATATGRGAGGHGADYRGATLWSGGFPCQDLSVAGKRAGFGLTRTGGRRDARTVRSGEQPESGERGIESGDGGTGPAFDSATRSGLAFAFLDLVERHRPPAILLENVPGLLSSNGGRDLGALLSRLAQLGYWWAYRILDAQHFGVPQRRRRVFVVALHAGAGFGADSAAAVLSVGARCDGHSAPGDEARERAAEGADDGAGVPRLAYALKTTDGKQSGSPERADRTLIASGPPPDPGRVRAADGLAGRSHDRPVAFRKAARVNADPDSPESWVDDGLANTLNNFDVGDIRTTHIAIGGGGVMDNEMLPLGLDSHRYRCCGNGVVAPVAEWVGRHLMAAIESAA